MSMDQYVSGIIEKKLVIKFSLVLKCFKNEKNKHCTIIVYVWRYLIFNKIMILHNKQEQQKNNFGVFSNKFLQAHIFSSALVCYISVQSCCTPNTLHVHRNRNNTTIFITDIIEIISDSNSTFFQLVGNERCFTQKHSWDKFNIKSTGDYE